MKSFVKHKLQEERGATIIMALFAFMVAALVSALILAAATSSVRQAKLDQENQQNLLILQSAGELIEKEVKTWQIDIVDTYAKKKKSDKNYTYADTAYALSSDCDKVSKSIAGKFKDALESTGKKAEDEPGEVGSIEFDIETNSSSVGFSQSVHVVLKFCNANNIDDTKSLKFCLSTSTANDSSANAYMLNISFQTEGNTLGQPVYSEDNLSYTQTRSLTWASAKPTYSVSGEGK